MHAYAMSQRANSLRVRTAAVAWGGRDARVNAVSPGAILTPLALDELSGPRQEWFEQVRKAATPVDGADLSGTEWGFGRVIRYSCGPTVPWTRNCCSAFPLLDAGVWNGSCQPVRERMAVASFW